MRKKWANNNREFQWFHELHKNSIRLLTVKSLLISTTEVMELCIWERVVRKTTASICYSSDRSSVSSFSVSWQEITFERLLFHFKDKGVFLNKSEDVSPEKRHNSWLTEYVSSVVCIILKQTPEKIRFCVHRTRGRKLRCMLDNLKGRDHYSWCLSCLETLFAEEKEECSNSVGNCDLLIKKERHDIWGINSQCSGLKRSLWWSHDVCSTLRSRERAEGWDESERHLRHLRTKDVD